MSHPGDHQRTTSAAGPAYRLVRTPARVTAAPHLDPAQQAVVDRVAVAGHGPLLVLAGPGTGKTTTLVEAVLARVAAGTHPERILTLTFSRKAAGELRDRIAARLGRTVMTQSAWTFHAFAYALSGLAQAAEDHGRVLRLLSGPEQDVVVRELLAGNVAEGTVGWPDELRAALPTRGFADEVRSLLARARGLGLEPDELRRLSTAGGGGEVRVDWAATADFLTEYLNVLDAGGLLDYSELVHRAVVYAESSEGRAELRARFDLVVVDEYQDTDPAQERLLQAIAGQGRDLAAVGDPDQSIYAFRGAEVRGLLEFRERFPRVDGAPASVLTLQVSRRAGSELLAASRSLAQRMSLAGAGLAGPLREHRALTAAPGLAPGSVEVMTFSSSGQQLDAVADLLRREHLDEGTPWSDMAVLVRSGATSLPAVRRLLGASGVPLVVAGDDLPLSDEPAIAPLLLALRVVADPEALTAEVARTLLLSPLGGADVAGLRRLGRALREEERLASITPDNPRGRFPRLSEELLREAVAEPERLVTAEDRDAAPAVRLGTLLARARAMLAAGQTTHEVLWLLWNGTPWPVRLERSAAAGGPAGRAASRDLDVVVALFELAARSSDRLERRGLDAFLDELQAQQIPADTLAEQGAQGDGVRVLTAHRSKGLEWAVVVLVDVQEDGWPDLRHRGSLLQPDRLTATGAAPPTPASARLAEERRLFYVATTRARRRLVVTAIDSAEDDGVRPSRFLGELGVPITVVRDRPRRPLTLPALVAELRAVSADPERTEPARRAAADRLATLAQARAGATELVPAADPSRWWGVVDLTDPGTPLHDPETPLRLSGSSLAGLVECPLKWFLDHEVQAQGARSSALGFGSVVHALAHDVTRSPTPPDLPTLLALIDTVWNQLAFEARWKSTSERVRAAAALSRFLAWHSADRGRTVIGSEVEFSVELTIAGRPVVLRGSVDRAEVDAEGFVHVVDLKTGKNPPSGPKVERHVQLGVYQVAVREGGFDEYAETTTGGAGGSGGAELVQLSVSGKPAELPRVQPQPPIDPTDPDWIDEVIEAGVTRIASEDFSPTPSEACRYCAHKVSCPTQEQGRQVVV